MVARRDGTQPSDSFDLAVPDLELEDPKPPGRTRNPAPEPGSGRSAHRPVAREQTKHLPDDEVFGLGDSTIRIAPHPSDASGEGAMHAWDWEAATADGTSPHRVDVSDADGDRDGFDAFGVDGFGELDGPDPGLELALEHFAPHDPVAREAPLTCTAPGRCELNISQEEIDGLAGFGSVPKSSLLAPSYAIRVCVRRWRLAAQVTQAEHDLAELELERDRLLASVVRRLRPSLERDERFKPAFDEADALEKRLGALGTRLANLEGGHAKEAAEQGAHLAEARQSLERARAAENRASSELDTAERNLARADARRKRLEIELRNAEKLTAAGAREAAAGPVAATLASIGAMEPELLNLGEAHASAKKNRDAARAETRKAESELERREGTWRRLDEDFSRQRMSGVAAMHDEEVLWVTTLANVMRSLLVAPGPVTPSEAELLAVKEVEGRLAEQALVAERFARAYGSHDATVVKQGLALLGAAAVALMALLVWLAMA